jgi:hypothetical protein
VVWEGQKNPFRHAWFEDVDNVVPSPHMYPSGHGLEPVIFEVLVKHSLPAGHGSQLVSSGTPRQGEKVPSEHDEHAIEEDEEKDRYVPG